MYALIHDNQLILGPIKYNYRLINSELENLEVEAKVFARSYNDVPIHFDDKTSLVPAIQIIGPCDSRYQSIGNFTWEIIRENEVPTKVEMTYEVNDKSLDQIKSEHKSIVPQIRWEKENTIIEVTLGDNTVKVSTNRENRLAYITKLISSEGPYNFKFDNNNWVEVTSTELQYIISQIDAKVQEAFDWELTKLQEIDACSTGEEVYNVVLREISNSVEN